jgi:hypothetical protein
MPSQGGQKRGRGELASPCAAAREGAPAVLVVKVVIGRALAHQANSASTLGRFFAQRGPLTSVVVDVAGAVTNTHRDLRFPHPPDTYALASVFNWGSALFC